MTQKLTFDVDRRQLFDLICGDRDANLAVIQELTGVNIIPRGTSLVLSSSTGKEEMVMDILHQLADLMEKKNYKESPDTFQVSWLVKSFLEGKPATAGDLSRLRLRFPETGKSIMPRSANQARYITSINNRAVTFGIGPAGTGKTFLAVAVAIKLFNQGEVDRIILTRPAVEAGESLGFLPGDFMQKINPYLRPLYDALFELQPGDKVASLIEKGTIEIAPLAYMRGRTLNNAVVILDEAQNTTISQMKMFLTRLGNGSRIVISGDVTQVDLQKNVTSGLIHASRILKNIDEVEFIKFDKGDITRHPVVEKIVQAYEEKSGTPPGGKG